MVHGVAEAPNNRIPPTALSPHSPPSQSRAAALVMQISRARTCLHPGTFKPALSMRASVVWTKTSPNTKTSPIDRRIMHCSLSTLHLVWQYFYFCRLWHNKMHTYNIIHYTKLCILENDHLAFKVFSKKSNSCRIKPAVQLDCAVIKIINYT